MPKPITIVDEDYKQWIQEIAVRYHRRQIRASIKVNQEMLSFYWELGRDIVSRHAENKYGNKFYASISHDLQSMLPNTEGLSERNIRYCKDFYVLYSRQNEILPQAVAKSEECHQLLDKLCAVPWGHHRTINVLAEKV